MIARKSALAFANTVVGAFLGLFAIALVARFMGTDIVNPVEFSLGFFGLLYFITDFGFTSAHTKRVSEGLDEGDCLATYAVFKAVATLAFLLLGAGVVLYVTVLRPGTLQDATAGVLLVILAYYVAKSLAGVPGATFEARRETARAHLLVLAENIVRIALTVLLALAFGGAVLGRGPFAGLVDVTTPVLGWFIRNPSAALGATFLAGSLAAVATGVVYLRRTARAGRFRWDILKGYWEFALPIALVSAVTVVATNVDRAFLGFFGAGNEAALYGYVRRITIFIETIPVTVYALLFPTISAYHGRGEVSSIREVRHQASRYTSMVVAPLVVFTIVFARQIIHIFLSDEWLPAATGLRILALYSLIVALSYPYMSLLSGTGRVRTSARIMILVATLNVVLNFVLIPSDLAPVGLPGVRLAGLGVAGAAAATATSALVGYVLFRIAAGRGGFHQRDVFLLKHLAAAAAMALVLAALLAGLVGSNPLGGDLAVRFYHLIVMGLLGGAVYLLALRAMGELGPDDIRRFVDTAHPGEMLDYVRRELRLPGRRP